MLLFGAKVAHGGVGRGISSGRSETRLPDIVPRPNSDAKFLLQLDRLVREHNHTPDWGRLAAQHLRSKKIKLTDKQQLELYSLFKQATVSFMSCLLVLLAAEWCIHMAFCLDVVS